MRATIREYQPVDFDACRTLWEELTQRHREIYDDPTIGGDDPGQGFEAYLANPERQGTWVAEVDGRVVALAGLIVKGKEGEIEPVVVSAEYRSRGIGTMLVRHVIEEAKVAGVGYVSVRPVARNREAMAFFVKLGFDLLGHVQLFQEFSGTDRSQWKSGISIHGQQLRY